MTTMRTIPLAVLGMVIGVVIGVGLFDHGPGVEPGVLAMAALGAAVAVLARAAAVRRRDKRDATPG